MCNDDQDYIDSLEEDAIEFDSKLDTLRKELAEVKAERDLHKDNLGAVSVRLMDVRAERDRLRDIVKDAYSEGWDDGYHRLGSKEHCWDISDIHRELEAK